MTHHRRDQDSVLHLWEGILLQAWEGVLYPQVGSQGVKNEAQLIRRQGPCTALVRIVEGWVVGWVVGGVAGWVAGRVAGWVAASVASVAASVAAWVVGWVAGWVVGWVAGWFADWFVAHVWRNTASTVLACCTRWGLPDTCGQGRQPSPVRDYSWQASHVVTRFDL